MNLKVIAAVVGVVALATLGVGVLMTGGLGGDTPAETDTGTQPGDDQSGSTATQTQTPSATVTETATTTDTERTQTASTPTASPTHTPTPKPLNLDDDQIAEYVAQNINDERRSRNIEPFDYEGLTAQKIAVMANNHSTSMAETGKTVHKLGNDSTAARYREHDLWETCKYKARDTGDVVKPDEEFETLAKTTVESHAQDETESRYTVTERELARTIVDKWLNSIIYEDRLFEHETQRLGVGVEVTDSGAVYATANVCA